MSKQEETRTVSITLDQRGNMKVGAFEAGARCEIHATEVSLMVFRHGEEVGVLFIDGRMIYGIKRPESAEAEPSENGAALQSFASTLPHVSHADVSGDDDDDDESGACKDDGFDGLC